MEITRTHSRPTGISIIAVLLFVEVVIDIVYGILAYSRWLKYRYSTRLLGLL
jgi:hypothetical protein